MPKSTMPKGAIDRNTLAAVYQDEISEYIQRLDELGAARQNFIEKEVIGPCVRPEIAESWKRCKSLKLSARQSRNQYLSNEALKDTLKKNTFLINVSSPILHSVHENLINASYLCVAFLTDREGIILDCIYHEALTEELELMGMKAGSIWQEQYVGTNSVSLALHNNQNFYTFGPEHYMDDHTQINCVTALIHNNDGEVAGTITISFYKEFFNDLMMVVFSTASDLIEKQFLNFRNMRIAEYTFNNMTEGMLILDSHMNVTQMNKKFLQLLKSNNVHASDLDIHMLFKDIDFDLLRCDTHLHTQIPETFLSYKSVYSRVSADIYRIEAYGTVDGFVILCRDINDIIALSQQFTSSATTFHFDTIVTKDPQMLALIEECKQAAKYKYPILLEGESGAGKEVFAQSIHNASGRSSKPFIAVNCAALPISLVESELFGYEKGSFTDGLSTGKAGKFEQANGGTIFLDEIEELPLDVQSKLLRVLDNYRVTRIGGKTEKKLDIRVIAATNRDLYESVQNKNFREDLFYRINVMNFKIPPLSKRLGDIPLLIDHFLNHLNLENRGIDKIMSQDCIDALCMYSWKGNVRELQNAVTRSYYLCNDTVITRSHLPASFKTVEAQAYPEQAMPTRANVEYELIRKALIACSGNISAAADQIRMSRATFYRKLKKYDIKY
ncbi:MAG TPA: sigma-54-dependent Fis family transcriptional regulator [Syntrophomonas sp.]|nr:sigma-54-dependent Fis family transcriptional regulator [Syntrophomonas sp.]